MHYVSIVGQGTAFRSPQDNSNEGMEQWKQLQIVLSRTGRYREVVTGNVTTERDARLPGV
jgi:hypothetical protein